MADLQETLHSSGITGILEDPDRETELLVGIARRVLDKARSGGADAAEVGVSSSLSREATVRMGEIEVLEEARDRVVNLSVYRGRRSGSASTGDLRPESIDEAVERALAIAHHTQPDPACGLADAEDMATEFPDLDLWHPADLDLTVLTERARSMEQAGREADPRVQNSEGASVSSEAAVGVYANTHGFTGAVRNTRYGQSCVLVAVDETGMQRDWDWDRQGRWEELADPAATGRGAAQRTVRRLGARKAATGKVPVLFTPEVAAGLIGHLVAAVSGGNLYRHSSFLIDSAGKRLFPDWVQIVEQPLLESGPRSSPFDAEGVATRRQPLVADGVLERYVLDSYSARKLGLKTTANAGGVRNLVFAPGERDQDELIAGIDKGLMVAELMGQGANLVTGDYSRGGAGFWIEGGEIVYPVEEFTIAGHLGEIFERLIAAGSDLETRRNLQVPSLLVEGITVAGS